MAVADAVQRRSSKLGVDLNGALGKDFFTQSVPGVLSNAKNAGNLELTGTLTDTRRNSRPATTTVSVTNVAGTLTYSVTRLSDKQSMGTFTTFPITFDGVSLRGASGTAQAGDSLPGAAHAHRRARPRRADARPGQGGRGIAHRHRQHRRQPGRRRAGRGHGGCELPGNAAGRATVTLSYDATTGSLTGFPATSAVTVTLADGTSTSYAAGTPVPYTAGAKMSFDGITVAMTGAPAQRRHLHHRQEHRGGVSDGSNALLLGALQRKTTMANGTATFNGAYSQMVSEVGNRAMADQGGEPPRKTALPARSRPASSPSPA